jgi:hypothetical protein
MVRDARHLNHPDVGRWPAHRLAEAAPSLFWQAPVAPLFDSPTAPKSEAVTAYVNEGRWVVGCPDCHGAQLGAREDHRFMCNCCANYAIGGLWRPVVWPKQVAAIDAALASRRAENAHWLPGETVAQLKRENADHGIGD